MLLAGDAPVRRSVSREPIDGDDAMAKPLEEIGAAALAMGDDKREENVYMAKLAEQAERYDEVALAPCTQLLS